MLIGKHVLPEGLIKAAAVQHGVMGVTARALSVFRWECVNGCAAGHMRKPDCQIELGPPGWALQPALRVPTPAFDPAGQASDRLLKWDGEIECVPKVA